MIKLRQLGGSIKGQASNEKLKSKVSGSQKSEGPRENDDSAQFLSNRSKKKSANKIEENEVSHNNDALFNQSNKRMEVKKGDQDDQAREEQKNQLSDEKPKKAAKGCEPADEKPAKGTKVRKDQIEEESKEEPPLQMIDTTKKGKTPDGFVQVEPDQERNLQHQEEDDDERVANQNRMESDRVSFSRAISLYREKSSCSMQSSMKGTRWSFGQKLEANTRFIFMPMESIKVKYRILQMVQATSYGDFYRI